MATVCRNRQLVYLSIIFFFYFSSIGCFAPFLTHHMQFLGFSQPELSFINAVAAFVSLIGPVIGGLIAERFNRYKSVCVVTMFVGAVAFAALSFVPKSERLQFHPLKDFSCRSGMRIERCVNWGSCAGAFYVKNSTTLRLRDCRYRCKSGYRAIPNRPLHICFHGGSGTICVVYDPKSGNNTATEFDTALSSWPYEERSNFDGYSEDVGVASGTAASSHDVFDLSLLEPGRMNDYEKLRANVSVCSYEPRGPIVLNNKRYETISCRELPDECDVHCRVGFSNGPSTWAPNLCEESNGNQQITFWSYLTLRCIGDLCVFTAVCLLDALLVCSTSDFEGAYGRLHVWPVIGMAAFAPFSGALLDHFTDVKGNTTFFPAVFVAAGLAVISCALIIALPIHNKRSSSEFQSLSTKGAKLFTFELFVFLAIVLVLGMQWGVISTFLPYLMMEIDCSRMVVGLSYTMIFGCCLPFLVISKNLVRNIGRANLLVFALLFYGTRYAGVSFVFSPLWTLPFAAMGSFTLCVMWIAAVAYVQSLVNPAHSIIMQYGLNLVHFGIGRGIGCLLGGTLISHHGLRVIFRGVAVFSACIGFLYLALYHLAIRREKVKKKGTFPTANGTWYPLRQQHPNGNAKRHHNLTLAEPEDEESDIPNTDGLNSK